MGGITKTVGILGRGHPLNDSYCHRLVPVAKLVLPQSDHPQATEKRDCMTKDIEIAWMTMTTQRVER